MSPTLLISREIPNLSYSPSKDRFDLTWEKPLSTLLGLGRAAGADFIEFFLEKTNYISCLAEDDRITSITPRLATGAGVRVFKGKADCYVSTNDLSFAGLKLALEKALSILGLHIPQGTSFIPEINLEMFRDYGNAKNKDNWLANCSSMQEMGDILLSANQTLAKKSESCSISSRRLFP